jgi:polyisoprenoid-binding protein YceI
MDHFAGHRFCHRHVAAADNYTVDPNHTYPSLEFSHMGLSIWRGKFNHTSGKVTLDRVARTGRVEIQVDTASIDFGLDSMYEHASGADWLDVEKYPTMTFTGAVRFEATCRHGRRPAHSARA